MKAQRTESGEVASVWLHSRADARGGEPDLEVPLSEPVLKRFRIEGELGRGAMGAVFRATRLADGTAVAIKILLRPDDDALERFEREARLQGIVKHANVIQLIDVGEVSGFPYLVTELVGGGSLKELLARRGKLPWREAAALVAATLDGLSACHACGIVHRDLKPANILLTETLVPKIADLGLARSLGPERALTATGAILGTPLYMAPEQTLADDTDARTDIYAMGLILHELIAGEPPIRAGTLTEMLKAKSSAQLVPLTKLVRDVPPELEALVLSAAARDPEQRPPSSAQFAADLRKVLAKPALARLPSRPVAAPPPSRSGAARAAGAAVALAAVLALVRAPRTGERPALPPASVVTSVESPAAPAASTTASAALRDQGAEAGAHLKKGRELRAARKLDEAYREFELANDAAHWEAPVLMGGVLEDRGDLAGALARYQDAARRFPREYWAHFFVGRTLHALKRVAEARGELETALTLLHTNRAADLELGAVLAELGDLEGAAKHLAAGRDPMWHGDDRAQLADVLERLGRHSEAEAEALAALEANPEHGDALNLVERAMKRTNRQADYEALLRRLATAAPSNVAAARLLALVESRNDPDAVEALLAQLVRSSLCTAELLFRHGELLRDRRKAPDRALAEFRAALALDPKHLSARLAIAEMLEKEGKLTEALAEIDVAQQYSPKNAWPHITRGSLFRMHKERDRARAEYRTALELEDIQNIPRLFLAQMAAEDRDPGRAVDLLLDALDRGAPPYIHATLLDVCPPARLADAIARYRKLSKSHAGDKDFQVALARLEARAQLH